MENNSGILVYNAQSFRKTKVTGAYSVTTYGCNYQGALYLNGIFYREIGAKDTDYNGFIDYAYKQAEAYLLSNGIECRRGYNLFIYDHCLEHTPSD